MELCCFCRAEISSATHKKKRKLLHRDACADAKSRLSAILNQRRGKGIEAFAETSCSTALLCFQCIGELDRLEALRRSFQDLDDLIGSRADSLVLIELPTTPVAPKRSATAPSSSTPKRWRLAPHFGSPFVRRVQESAQRLEDNPDHQSPPCAVS